MAVRPTNHLGEPIEEPLFPAGNDAVADRVFPFLRELGGDQSAERPAAAQ